MAKRPEPLIGKRFGRLTIVEELPTIIQPAGGHCRVFKCKCDCGNEKIVRFTNLIQGGTTSCGCAHYNIYGLHGLSKDPKWVRLYTIYINMMDRCNNPKNRQFHNYGGRGIKVCSEWDNFIPFRDWALSNGYTDELTIDRIDVNGNYEPSNCRWATQLQQARNMRTTKMLEHHGVVKAIGDWADEYGLSPALVRERLRQWPNASSDKILSPKRKNQYK